MPFGGVARVGSDGITSRWKLRSRPTPGSIMMLLREGLERAPSDRDRLHDPSKRARQAAGSWGSDLPVYAARFDDGRDDWSLVSQVYRGSGIRAGRRAVSRRGW